MIVAIIPILIVRNIATAEKEHFENSKRKHLILPKSSLKPKVIVKRPANTFKLTTSLKTPSLRFRATRIRSTFCALESTHDLRPLSTGACLVKVFEFRHTLKIH